MTDLLALASRLPRPTAFVLGGGGSWGALQLGMLQALAETDLTPDLVVGTSVGSLNGAVLADNPALAVERLEDLWPSVSKADVFPGGWVRGRAHPDRDPGVDLRQPAADRPAHQPAAGEVLRGHGRAVRCCGHRLHERKPRRARLRGAAQRAAGLLGHPRDLPLGGARWPQARRRDARRERPHHRRPAPRCALAGGPRLRPQRGQAARCRAPWWRS